LSKTAYASENSGHKVWEALLAAFALKHKRMQTVLLARAGISARKQKSEYKMSIIAKHGTPEPCMSDDSPPGIQLLSRMRVKRKGQTGTSAMGANRFGGN
jgi:hypothetical protein